MTIDSRVEAREFNTTGWVLMLLNFCVNMLWGCTFKSIGVLLPVLTDQFSADTWIIGTVASLTSVAADVSGLLAAPLENKFATRWVLTMSALMVSLGWFVVSFATSVVHIAGSLIVFVGAGMGILNVLSKAFLARHFRKNTTLAYGLSNTGNAVALLVFAPMTQLFLDTYGWRGATLLVAGVCANSIPCAALVRVTKKSSYQPLSCSNEDETASLETKSCHSYIGTLCAGLWKVAGFGIVFELNFIILYLCRFSMNIAYNSWMVYFVPHLQAKGFSPQVAAALCVPPAIAYFIGTSVWAPFIDRGLVRCSSGIVISSLVLAASFIVDPWVDGDVGTAVNNVLFGLSISALYTLGDILTKERFGMDRLTSVFAWVRAFGFLPRLLGGFFPGWMYDTTGTYDVAYVVIGSSSILTLIPLVVQQLWKSHLEKRSQSA
ncbi:monocarboxylate transporter 12-like [Acanthaster planci]|uniref:Monocarboxylate transporter 12-like n=1 Tax=Acanthaster planci TaxID=133434 RepID=A0A8B7XHV6_ACAPL|nr:monocarboxylate transporter 12-like [Acanthaster planci]